MVVIETPAGSLPRLGSGCLAERPRPFADTFGIREKLGDGGARKGRGEQESLHLGAALFAYKVELRLGLDALGGRRHAERAAKADDRLDDGPAVFLRREILYEGLVDLDL